MHTPEVTAINDPLFSKKKLDGALSAGDEDVCSKYTYTYSTCILVHTVGFINLSYTRMI